MVTFAPRLEVPDTDNVDRLVAAPSRSTLPVMVKAFAPPARVDPKLIIVPVKILSPPDKVTAPEYVCVPEVVILPPISDAPAIVNAELPVELEIVPLRFNVAKVWVDCKSNVAPLAILKSVRAFTDPVNLMVPADIVVSPEYVLVPDKV